MNIPALGIDISLFQKAEMQIMTVGGLYLPNVTGSHGVVEELHIIIIWATDILEKIEKLVELKMRIYVQQASKDDPKLPGEDVVDGFKTLSTLPKMARVEVVPYLWTLSDKITRELVDIVEEYECKDAVAVRTKGSGWQGSLTAV